MDLSTFQVGEQRGQDRLVLAEASLYRAFEKVKDGRKEKGVRYPLAFVLTLLMLEKMAGETTISGVMEWIREREKDLRKKLNWPKDFPSRNTYTDILMKTDQNEILIAIKNVISEALEIMEKESKLINEQENSEMLDNLTHTAMDGKALRGTRKHAKDHHPSVHL